MRLYVINLEITDILVYMEGYGYYPNPNEPPILFEVTVRKMSWEDFQQRLTEWTFNERLACTVVNKNEIYITEVTFNYDTDKVRELELCPATEIEEYANDTELTYLGLPAIVYCHLIGQLKTELTTNQ